MIVFPEAKINLGLNVVARRDDGFHAIQSVMTRIPLCDVLELVIDEKLPAGALKMDFSGIPIPQDTGSELCALAHAQISSRTALPGLRGHLHKNIPIGGGLGGGSSDSAAMLQLVNQCAQEPLETKELLEIGESLGSDIPFFLKTGIQAASGRGELLEPLDVSLNGLHGAIVNPGIHISTAAAYRHTVKTGKNAGFKEALSQPIASWKHLVFNSMESYALEKHPVLADIKRSLYAAGASFALMSGSGSTVFGLFEGPVPELLWPEAYTYFSFKF